jgi:hypothetical protein
MISLRLLERRVMLRSFRFANHKSFRDEADLLLVPAYDKSRSVVPVAGVFGANASGKSNLLDALRWLQTAVLDSYRAWSPGLGVPRRPFRLDPTAEAGPSWFCIELVRGDARYTYGLEVDDEQVREEWLYAYPRNRRRVIFERRNRTIRLGSTVPDYRSRGELLAKNTRPNALFLTVAAHNDLTEVGPVFQWSQTDLTFASDRGVSVQEGLARWLWGPDRERIVALVRAADLGISDIAIRQQPMLPSDIAERIAKISAGSPGTGKTRQIIEVLEEFEGQDPFVPPSDLAAPPLILFYHGSDRAVLDFYDQSAGTRSWLGLVANALQTLERGGVLVVDGVDASLHPHLTARLIELFRDAETNAVGAQLLFTTHDATLLDEEILARDETWFVEKDPDDGATKLYPLTDFHPRKNENVEGRYLAGGYGAVPVLTHTGFRDALEVKRSARAAA